MRIARFLILPVLLIAVLGCGLSSGIQQLQQAATQLPAILTAAPTELGSMATAAAGQSSGTPLPGTLGISMGAAETVLQITNQFSFTDGTTGGQPETIAKLNSGGASSFPAIANGFKAEFIGDPQSISKIMINVPRTDDQATVDEGIEVIPLLFAGVLPPEVQVGFTTWYAQNYAALPVGSQQQITVATMMFTLSRSQTDMTLEVDPAQ